MFIAGDPSGDIHASPIIRRLRETDPSVQCFGIGGPAMAAQGFKPLLPFGPFNRMGFLEVIKGLPFFIKAKKQIIHELISNPPGCLVLVDYPGFNMQVLKTAKHLGIPAVWYIAPKVWAWKSERAQVLGNNAAVIATIFPFETKIFNRFPARVEFVGNPLVESLSSQGAFSDRERHPYDGTREFTLALVPGSRRQELHHLLRPMVKACMLLRKEFPLLKALVSRCPWLPPRCYDPARTIAGMELFDGNLDDLLSRSDAALVTSGTATLQTALHGVPHVIVYKTSYISYRIYRHVIRIPWIGLPNIISQKSIVPECIQQDAAPERLAHHLRELLSSSERYIQNAQKLLYLRNELGSKKPSEEMSRIITDIIRTHTD